jgi:hypothetical protein
MLFDELAFFGTRRRPQLVRYVQCWLGSRGAGSNCWYMLRAGLPELETVEFEPITRFDSVGKEHTIFPGAGASQNRLYLKGTAVNGRIEEQEGTPTVVVDGCEYTWEEFGRFLSSFTGFNFRLECFDACEDSETTPDPERPDPVWWLSEDEPFDSDDPRRH